MKTIRHVRRVKTKGHDMRYLLTSDIARDLGLNLRTVQKYIKEGFLPASFDYSGITKQYIIDPNIYHEWKQNHFNGLKKGQISKYSRHTRPLTKPEILDFIPNWLLVLSNGTFNGRVYSQRTIETYDYFLRYYLKALGPHVQKPLISKDNLKQIFASISPQQYATKQKIYDAIMCFSKYLQEVNHINNSEREELKKLRPKRFLPAEKISLSEKQINDLLAASQTLTGNGVYDKLLTKTLIIFLKETGLRASELCNLKLKDIDLEARIIYIWHGKGNKNRKVGITNDCYKALIEYLKTRINTEAEYFFINRDGNKLTRNNLRLRWSRLSKICGFKISNHSFRRSFVTINVNKGKPLVHLQIAAGHSDIKTTRGYCLTSENEVTEAMRNW